MGCASSRADGTLEGEREPSIMIKRSEVKFVPPRPGQLYVRPEEHRKLSGEAAQGAEDNANWKGLWRPSSIDEAGGLLVRQLRLQDHSCGYQSGALLEVLCNAFQSGSACVALLEQPNKVLVWSGTGLCEAGTHAPWMLDFLQCCLQTANNEVTIVEDAHKDARVRDSEAITGGGGVASFVGAPLVAASGVRIGALCVFRGEPTRYDAVPVALLAGLAELTMRELEAEWAQAHVVAKGLQRPRAAYEIATMLVDASQHAWKVLYINPQASGVTGVSLRMAGASTFWGLFSCPDAGGDHPWSAYTDFTENSADFSLRNVQRLGSPNHAVFSLTFTPVTRVMDECTIPIGVPCLAEAQLGSRQFFFVRISLQKDAQPDPRPAHQAVPIPGLELGTLLAVSPYGRTHRGFYKDQPVAVKIVPNGRRNVRFRDGRPLAIAVTDSMRDSSVPLVRTYAYATHPPRSRANHQGKPEQANVAPEGEACYTCGEAPGACACAMLGDDRHSLCQMSDSACSLNEGDCATCQEIWLVQEYCSLGTLQLAIAQGKFQKASSGRACCTAILDVACDVSAAMATLHAQGVTHGNLAASSILLTPTSRNAYGFRAKVSDWGIARELDTRGFATPQCYPCLAHLAPEVLLQGKLSKAADVYSFGVLLWEMAAGQRMFAGMPWAQVMGAITLRHARPRLPPGRAIPSGLEPVLRMCLSACPADRPSFHELTNIIRAVRASSLQKAAERRKSCAVETVSDAKLAPRCRHSSSSTSNPETELQEGAVPIPQVSGPDMKQAAAMMWGSDPWRARSIKEGAVEEWRRVSSMAQQPAPGKLGSHAVPEADQEGQPGCRDPPNANVNIPYNSQTKARAANMRLSTELRRAGHGRCARSKAPTLPAPGQLGRPSPAPTPSLPPSTLYHSSRPTSNASSCDERGQSGSSDRAKSGASKHPHSISAGGGRPGALNQATDDRLGLTEVAHQRSSFGGSWGSYSSCHSESGYTHTAAHLSFTELKRHKQKNLAAGLSALRDSLLPESQGMNTCSAADVPQDAVPLEHSQYIPSGSIEKIGCTLPQLRISTRLPVLGRPPSEALRSSM